MEMNKSPFIYDNAFYLINKFIMKKWLNDPSINKQYNYLYKITNKINNKIYIGVHRTNNLNDGYMGSGLNIRRAIKKYGKENFIKEIIQFFDTYKEALEKEKSIVTLDFLKNENNYNVREGGYGNCKWSPLMIEQLSKSAKKRWEDPEYKEKVLKSLKSKKRNDQISKKVKKWIKENPQKHRSRILKINKNPEKIQKTAEFHKGRKRSKETCQKISNAVKEFNKSNPNYLNQIYKTKKAYVYNPNTLEVKRLKKGEDKPNDWKYGYGPRKDKTPWKGKFKGTIFGYHKETLKLGRFKSINDLPENYLPGRPKKQNIKK